MSPHRTIYVRIPCWGLITKGYLPNDLVATVKNGIVVEATPQAQTRGVEEGARATQAQAKCVDLKLVDRDELEEDRQFEAVIEAIEQVAAGVVVYRAGEVSCKAIGPASYFKGEEPAANLMFASIGERLPPQWGSMVRLGIADGVFCARIATMSNQRSGPVTIVDVGNNAQFLSSWPIWYLADPKLSELAISLGLTTIGDWAQLSSSDVLARFGEQGLRLWNLANGGDLSCSKEPLEKVEYVYEHAFDVPVFDSTVCVTAAQILADQLIERLNLGGVSCVSVRISLMTSDGDLYERVWCSHDAMCVSEILQRLTWQLDTWRSAKKVPKPTTGVTLCRLSAEALVPSVGTQLSFWDKPSAKAQIEDCYLGLSQIVGPDNVKIVRAQGGVGPGEQTQMVRFEQCDFDQNLEPSSEPWPLKLVAPSPIKVLDAPTPVEILDADGKRVVVSAKGELSSDPSLLCVATTRVPIVRWSSPWTCELYWWNPHKSKRIARLQLLGEQGQALLVHVIRGVWQLEGVYE